MLREVGERRDFGFEPRDHLDIGVELGWIDRSAAPGSPARASSTAWATSRCVELALYRFALDRLVAKGFVPVLPPVLVREQAMYGTGFLPTDDVNIYHVERDDLYLTGTSEVALAGLHMEEILAADDLPLRYAGYSTCFRREAGAAGKDTRGIFRVHQFDKVEMYSFARPEDSRDEHEYLLAVEEELVQELGIPYRVVNVAAGDLGAVGGQEVRHRGLVPGPAALPRDHLDLEHDRLPGAAARDPLPRRRPRPRARPHAERDGRHRALAGRDHRELPGRERLGRRAVRARALRRPLARRGRRLSTALRRLDAAKVLAGAVSARRRRHHVLAALVRRRPDRRVVLRRPAVPLRARRAAVRGRDDGRAAGRAARLPVRLALPPGSRAWTASCSTSGTSSSCSRCSSARRSSSRCAASCGAARPRSCSPVRLLPSSRSTSTA